MPKQKHTKPSPKQKPTRLFQEPTVCTHEAASYIDGAFEEFRENVIRYHDLIRHELALQARLEMSEKTLCLMRDHLALTIEQAGPAGRPLDWQSLFREVRFVGVRLVDACMTLLQEHQKLTPEELLTGLNGGMYRFRTSSPLREIHAAMLRQRRAHKIGDTWVWAGGGEQISMRLRVTRQPQTLTEGPKNEAVSEPLKSQAR